MQIKENGPSLLFDIMMTRGWPVSRKDHPRRMPSQMAEALKLGQVHEREKYHVSVDDTEDGQPIQRNYMYGDLLATGARLRQRDAHPSPVRIVRDAGPASHHNMLELHFDVWRASFLLRVMRKTEHGAPAWVPAPFVCLLQLFFDDELVFLFALLFFIWYC